VGSLSVVVGGCEVVAFAGQTISDVVASFCSLIYM